MGAAVIRSIDLQRAYEGSLAGGPHVTVDATRGPMALRDNATPQDVLTLQDNAGGTVARFSQAQTDLGQHDAISTTKQPIARIQDAANSIAFWPTDRTFNASQGALAALLGTYVMDYASVSFGGLNLQATIQHNQAGFAFNHGLLFNHGNNYFNQLNVAANFGPLQGFIDQPSILVNRTTGGTVSMGLFRSFLSQPTFGRQSTSGTLSVTAAANFQALGQVQTGATIATFRRAQLGPFFVATGTITQMYGVDVADEPGPTNITSIRIQQNAGGGTRRAIDVSGTAVSTFGGALHMNNAVPLALGSVAANRVELSRSAAGVMRMIGAGGTFDEGLDWDFDPAIANNVEVTSTTGAGLWLNLARIAFGSVDASPTANNSFVAWAAPSKTQALAGEFWNVELLAGGTNTANSAGTTGGGLKVSAPTLAVTGAGSWSRASTLEVQGNVNLGTDRYGLYILSNPSGGGGLNHSLRSAGSALFDQSVEIDGDLDHDGSNAGFFGTAPTTQQNITGSRGGNAALASLLTGLANLGLITDSSTA